MANKRISILQSIEAALAPVNPTVTVPVQSQKHYAEFEATIGTEALTIRAYFPNRIVVKVVDSAQTPPTDTTVIMGSEAHAVKYVTTFFVKNDRTGAAKIPTEDSIYPKRPVNGATSPAPAAPAPVAAPAPKKAAKAPKTVAPVAAAPPAPAPVAPATPIPAVLPPNVSVSNVGGGMVSLTIPTDFAGKLVTLLQQLQAAGVQAG